MAFKNSSKLVTLQEHSLSPDAVELQSDLPEEAAMEQKIAFLVEHGMPVADIPAAIEDQLLAEMRVKQEKLRKEMVQWDQNPIWKAYDEEATRVANEINQKYTF